MRILFALPGFHRYDRGAEVALLSLAAELARSGDQVTVMGSGYARKDTPYSFRRVGSLRRELFERFPRVPILRQETGYEELTFLPGLIAAYHPSNYDINVTCSYPFTNLALRRPNWRGERPRHIFVTQNGDWPALSSKSEYRFFGCDGLVCTNPDYLERNQSRWRCALIPNGLDTSRFSPGPSQRSLLGLPTDKTIVLMVSALIETKRVENGIRAVAGISNAHLVVAGDGPLRAQIDALAAAELPGRFTRLSVSAAEMPDLYRSADVFLHLSEQESFGNVYVEALACGVPIVAHDSARLRWIVGDDQFLVDTSEKARIREAVCSAAVAPVALRARRVAQAAQFAWPKVAERYRNFFSEILEP